MKVYAICLDGYNARLEFQKTQASRYGLELEIVTAIDAKKLSDQDLQKAANCWSRPITAKDLGCFLSHKKVWGLMKDREETAVIIEDDIVFSPNISNVIDEISSNFTHINEIYDLEFVPRKHWLAKKETWRSNSGQITASAIYQNKNGLGCYCLSSDSASRLFFEAEMISFEHADAFVWTRGWGRFLQIEPAPALQMIYHKEYNQTDAENLKTRRTIYTNQSWLSARLISCKRFFVGAKQSIKGYILGVSRNILCNLDEFKKI